MSKTKMKSKFSFALILLASAALLVFGGVLGLSGRNASAEVNVKVADEIESKYAFGDEFALPSCTFEKEGKSVEGVGSLQYPDGTLTKEKLVTLNQSGEYTLQYIASIDNQVYTKEYDFTVHGRLASYTSDKTSMEYGRCTHLGASSKGLTVRIANGDALAFDHVFDMNELTMSTKLLEGFVLPNTHGAVDFAKMVFTFTDVEDPSVQLVYHGNFYDDSNAHGLTYFTAAGNGQIHCGLEHVGRLHVGSSLGCMVPHSFMAMDTGLYWGAKAPEPTAPDAKTFCISYDGKSNQAWAGGKIISDLDDSNYYSSLWFGFPSGKAKLTISALNYNDATANICFTSILGVDLSAENYIDEEAPSIAVHSDYAEMPQAVVGKSYPIPSATALDQVNGECGVNVSVWYNYGAENQKMVDVVDGKFKADSVGVYAIVYTSNDHSGNVAKEILWVRAALSQYIPKLTVTLNDSFATDITVGTLQTLPSATVEGGSGDKTVTYTVTKGKQVCEIKNGAFRLEEAGEWTLTCTAVDYVGNAAVAVLTLKGEVSDKPIITDAPNLPFAYVSGSSYELPVLYAYDYTSGKKVQKICEVRVECDGKTSVYTSGEKFTPTVANDKDFVKIVYTCDGEALFEKEVPVLIVFGKEKIPSSNPNAPERFRDVVNVEKYFYTEDGLTLTNKYPLADITGLKVTAEKEAESAKIAFANMQMADTFSLNFMTVPGESKFSQVNIRLTDSVDSNVSVKAELIKDEGQTLMAVGDTVLTLTLDFDKGVATPYNVGFAGGKFTVNTTTSVAVSKTESGEDFNGFPSGKIYFEIEMQNASKNASIFISKICNINVSNTQDNTGPFLSTMENVVTNAFKDSTYTVQKILACDILCPNTEAFLTVLDPNGEVVKSVDGTLLEGVDATKEYQISLSAYGDYNVSVTAKEGGGWKYSNESYFDYIVTVTDGEAPTIDFKKDFAKKLKVGDTLSIPKYTVSDNFTKAEDIVVLKMIINPKGMPIYLYGDDNGIRCEYAGIYQIKIYVYDEMGNLTVFEKSVKVV